MGYVFALNTSFILVLWKGKQVMPLMDEFKEERETLKNAGFKAKWDYFWEYNKTRIIIISMFAFLVIAYIYSVLTTKEEAIFVSLLNSVPGNPEAIYNLEEDYAEYAGIDTEEYEIVMDTSISLSESGLGQAVSDAVQRLTAYIASGKIDLIIGGSDMFVTEANQGIFVDLRTVLTEEEIAAYEPYFYYVDQAHIDMIKKPEYLLDITKELPKAPDPRKPEEMEKPIPVGLFVSHLNKISDAYYFSGDYSALGILVNAPHPEKALQFVEYVFE